MFPSFHHPQGPLGQQRSYRFSGQERGRPLPVSPADKGDGPSAKTQRTLTLIQRLHQGSAQALESLIQEHLGLITSVARRCALPNIPLAERIEAGKDGLIDAVMGYSPEHGTEFSTFAVYKIQNAIRKHFPKATQAMASLDQPVGTEQDAPRVSLLSGPTLPPDELLAQQEKERALQRGMAQLPLLPRLIFSLQVGLNHTPALDTPTVCEVTGLTPGEVQTLGNQAQKLLQEALKHAPLEPPLPDKPSDWQVQGEARALLTRLVARYRPIFSPAQQSLLTGYFEEGHAVERLADALGRNVHYVKAGLTSAMTRLEEYLIPPPLRHPELAEKLSAGKLPGVQSADLLHLSQQQRTIFEHHIGDRMPLAQVAILLRSDPLNIKNQYNKGLRTLKDVLAARGEAVPSPKALSLLENLEREGLPGIEAADLGILSEMQRQILTAYFESGGTYRGAAQQLGTEDSNASQRVKVALQKLKEHRIRTCREALLLKTPSREALVEALQAYGEQAIPQAAWQRLSDGDQRVLQQRLILGWPRRQVAQLNHIQEVSVAHNERNALNNLIRQLEELAQKPPETHQLLERLQLFWLKGISPEALSSLTQRQLEILRLFCEENLHYAAISQRLGSLNPTSVKKTVLSAVKKIHQALYPPQLASAQTSLQEVLAQAGFSDVQASELEALTADEQKVLACVFRQKQSCTQAGETLNMPRGTVFTIKKRALEKLGQWKKDPPPSPEAYAHPEETLLGKLERQGLAGITQACLEDLTEGQWEVLNYHVMQGWTFVETARHLGVHPSAIGLRKMRLMKQLRKRLEASS